VLQRIDDRFCIFRKDQVVLDLGCSPGGWSQVALMRTSLGASSQMSKGQQSAARHVVGVDKLPMKALPQHVFVQGDISSSDVQSRLLRELGSARADVLLSDFGVEHSHRESVELYHLTMALVSKVLKTDGWLVARLVRGTEEDRILAELEGTFGKVRQVRILSSQVCLVCSGYSGVAASASSGSSGPLPTVIEKSMQVRPRRMQTMSQEVYLMSGGVGELLKVPALSAKQRQLEDEYVQLAKKEGYRCRSAYKLLQMDDAFRFFKRDQVVVDLGCAPGGWSQVALARIEIEEGRGPGRVVGVDKSHMEPLQNHNFVKGDFRLQDVQSKVLEEVGAGGADVVLSDMAPKTRAVGYDMEDHAASVDLCSIAEELAVNVLKRGGCFIFKLFRGPEEHKILVRLRARFQEVLQVQPSATRSASREVYIVCSGYGE